MIVHSHTKVETCLYLNIVRKYTTGLFPTQNRQAVIVDQKPKEKGRLIILVLSLKWVSCPHPYSTYENVITLLQHQVALQIQASAYTLFQRFVPIYLEYYRIPLSVLRVLAQVSWSWREKNTDVMEVGNLCKNRKSNTWALFSISLLNLAFEN